MRKTRGCCARSPQASRWSSRDGDLRTITLLVGAQSLLWGFLSVYLVVIAARELGTGPEGVGYFNAILGIGTVLGGILVLGRVAKGRLAQDMAVGVLGWAIPLLAIAIAPTPVVALLALAVIGTSDPWVNLGFETIPQRLAPERVISRVYAAAESTAVASVAIGALLAPLALDLIGLRGALGAAGTLVGLYTLSCLPRLRGLDHRLGEPEGLPLLRGVPMLEPVAPSVLEELAHRLVSVAAAPGEVVVREGDTADRFYVIESGEVEVTHDAEVLRREGVGDYFGEIGLLRDVPRTATGHGGHRDPPLRAEPAGLPRRHHRRGRGPGRRRGHRDAPAGRVRRRVGDQMKRLQCARAGPPTSRTAPASASRADAGLRPLQCGCGTELRAGRAVLLHLRRDARSTTPPDRRLRRRWRPAGSPACCSGTSSGFTRFSESRDQEEVRELLRRYFEECRGIVGHYGGTVEKFIGDAVMAVWGVPTAHEDDAERAVRAGLEMVARVAALGEDSASRASPCASAW